MFLFCFVRVCIAKPINYVKLVGQLKKKKRKIIHYALRFQNYKNIVGKSLYFGAVTVVYLKVTKLFQLKFDKYVTIALTTIRIEKCTNIEIRRKNIMHTKLNI